MTNPLLVIASLLFAAPAIAQHAVHRYSYGVQFGVVRTNGSTARAVVRNTGSRRSRFIISARKANGEPLPDVVFKPRRSFALGPGRDRRVIISNLPQERVYLCALNDAPGLTPLESCSWSRD